MLKGVNCDKTQFEWVSPQGLIRYLEQYPN